MSAILKQSSAAVGWAIALGKKMKEQANYIRCDLAKIVRKRLSGLDPRLTTGYATLLYFTEQV